MSTSKGSKTSGVKTLKLKRGPLFIEVTAGVVKDKSEKKKPRGKSGATSTRKKK